MTTFYFTIPTIIDRISLEVLYKTRKRNDVLGIGENSIVDAEILVKEYISTIAYDIFDKLISPFGRTLSELDTPLLPFEFDVSYTQDGEVTAGSFVVGRGYTILLPGTTDFTLIGAADSEIGTEFTATGIGTGTGTATYTEIEECILYRCIWPQRWDYSVTPAVLVDSNTFDQSTIPAIHKAIEETIVSFAVWQWLMDSNINGWQIYEDKHIQKYDNLRSLTTRRINLKRTYKLY